MTVMGVPLHRVSLSEFMAWEANQEGRHEFHRGEVFAMVGGRRSDAAVLELASVGLRIVLPEVFYGMDSGPESAAG
jgi:hypothetical protein